MASPAQVLRAALTALGLVQNASVNPVFSYLPMAYVSAMPDEQDTAVCFYDILGRMHPRIARTGKSNIDPGILIRVRTPDYSGFSIASRLAAAVDTKMSPLLVVDEDNYSHWIQNVRRNSQVVSVGEEVGKKRQIFVFRAEIVFQDNESSIA